MKKTNNYVDNVRFTKELKEYIEIRDKALEEGKEIPLMSNFIGECIVKIAKNYIYSSKFRRVYAKDVDDAISYGCEYATRAIQTNFDPAKCSSGFSFVTSAIRYGYLNALTASKKHLNKRNRIMEAVADGQFDVGLSNSDLAYHSASLEKLRETVDQYKQEEENEKSSA